jgi:hypothetical protein
MFPRGSGGYIDEVCQQAKKVRVESFFSDAYAVQYMSIEPLLNHHFPDMIITGTSIDIEHRPTMQLTRATNK